ncbi:PREDICTED: uncharacterized protein LOC104806674 isoform X1 [Tarenaya hassleriana]|uniref:uncharacterized protein LOC104806674 isoform X1 n=1 Tax=Tarenaya hassleriana TaxID=28532 RepID=UPI0008FD5715|nr:PREDICTED: uncharacterized protein LOC104806674 isoform X1 [Tarenaya hassleriana]
MSAPPISDAQSFRRFTSATLHASATTDVEPKLGDEVHRGSSPAPGMADRGIGSWSTRQQRLSFSSLAPSSAKPVHENQKGLGDATAREEQRALPQRGEVPVDRKEEEEEEEEGEVKRTWNLRPRRSSAGSKKINGVFSQEACGGGGGLSEVKHQKSGVGMEPKSSRHRGVQAESRGLGGGEGRNENPRLWVALSRDEIEEDIFSMSGNRPSRRPRKRPKTLQKHLDVMFPGLSLVGLNADLLQSSQFSVQELQSVGNCDCREEMIKECVPARL